MLNDWQRYRIDELRRRAQRSGMAAEVGAMVFDAMVRLLEDDVDISADSLIAELEHACREWDCG